MKHRRKEIPLFVYVIYPIRNKGGKARRIHRRSFTGNMCGVGEFVSCVCLHSAVLVCARNADYELANGCLTVVVVVQKWVPVWRCVSCAYFVRNDVF